ncbi:MAG: glycosyltransferase family 4 protein [Kiritimatiellia bacterium]
MVLTTGHRPDDDRIFYKQVVSLMTVYPRILLVAPVRPGETYQLAPAVELHPLTGRPGLCGRLLRILQAARQVVRLRPDVCHFHDLDFVVAVPALRWLTRTRFVYDAHEVYPESMLISPKIPAGLRPLAARIVDVVEKACARRCALVVTADEPNSESFVRTRVPTITLFNYPRLSLFAVDPRRLDELRREYAGRRVLIYQGTMSRERGLFHMLDGMRQLKDDVPTALLLLVGLKEPDLRAQAEAQIGRDGLADHVAILPWVPHADVPAYVALADVGLAPLQPNPKFNKNIPLKVFEYMACGVPVLAADLPAIAHFIADSGAGVLYDSTDSAAFAREVRRLLADDAGRAAMAQAGRAAVARRWNWGEMEKRLLAAYAELENGMHARNEP